MAKFKVGEKVSIAFNPPVPDLRVPLQANGTAVGRGDYQTTPHKGVVLEVNETDSGYAYLLDVELAVEHTRNGKPYVVKSLRKRVVPESKLMAA